MSDSKGAAIREKLVHILYGDWISYELIESGRVAETDTKKIDAILAILAQEVNSEILEVLGRINDKAMACAAQKGTGYEELAKVYDKAVMKELADLTQ